MAQTNRARTSYSELFTYGYKHVSVSVKRMKLYQVSMGAHNSFPPPLRARNNQRNQVNGMGWDGRYPGLIKYTKHFRGVHKKSGAGNKREPGLIPADFA